MDVKRNTSEDSVESDRRQKGTRRRLSSFAAIVTACLFVLGAMLLSLDGIIGFGAGDRAHAFTGSWILSGTAVGDSPVNHDLDGSVLELRSDGTASYTGRDATSLLVPDAATIATWSTETSSVGVMRVGTNAYRMTLDAGHLVLETNGGTLVFIKNEQ